MKLFLYCLLSFSFAWLVHWLIWRVALPKKHTRALLVIFFSVLTTVLLLGFTSILPSLNVLQAFHIMVFYIPTTLAYICFYSAVEEDSPSVGLIQLTAKKKECRLEDYYSVINSELLIDSRLSAMVRDGLLVQTGDRYQLTPKGTRLGRLFSIAHSFLQLKAAG